METFFYLSFFIHIFFFFFASVHPLSLPFFFFLSFYLSFSFSLPHCISGFFKPHSLSICLSSFFSLSYSLYISLVYSLSFFLFLSFSILLSLVLSFYFFSSSYLYFFYLIPHSISISVFFLSPLPALSISLWDQESSIPLKYFHECRNTECFLFICLFLRCLQ